MVWSAEPTPAVFDALNAIAGCVGYLGHSASLVRCRFRSARSAPRRNPARPAHRRVYPGRLRELEIAHDANPVRPTIRPGAPVFAQEPDPVPLDDNWLALEVVKGEVPDVRATALVCRVLRNALMSGYRKAGMGAAIPEVVSGHTPSGAPTRQAHLAIAPLAFGRLPPCGRARPWFRVDPAARRHVRRNEGAPQGVRESGTLRREDGEARVDAARTASERAVASRSRAQRLDTETVACAPNPT